MTVFFPDDRFGSWLRTQRLQQRLTPDRLALDAGCDTALLLQLESGHIRELDSRLCRRLLSALHISPDTPFPPDEMTKPPLK